MIHAGGNARLRAGVQYVLFNLIGSTLFLFALGSIYAETGTLNMADLANRVQLIGPEETVGIRVAAVLLLAGLCHQGRPGAAALLAAVQLCRGPAPVAALVRDHDQGGRLCDHPGLYDDLPSRAGGDGGPVRQHEWLLPAALLSLAIGMIGCSGGQIAGPAWWPIRSSAPWAWCLWPFRCSAPKASPPRSTISCIRHWPGRRLFLISDLVRTGRGNLDLTAHSLPWRAPAVTAGLFFAGRHRHGGPAAPVGVPGQASGAGRGL